MKLAWSLFALSDRDAIFSYIEQDSPRAAARLDDLIEQEVDRLRTSPKIGRIGRISGTRELVIGHTPYLAAYRIEHDSIILLRILHGAQQWPDTMDPAKPD